MIANVLTTDGKIFYMVFFFENNLKDLTWEASKIHIVNVKYFYPLNNVKDLFIDLDGPHLSL